jgi:hypothetical protein
MVMREDFSSANGASCVRTSSVRLAPVQLRATSRSCERAMADTRWEKRD